MAIYRVTINKKIAQQEGDVKKIGGYILIERTEQCSAPTEQDYALSGPVF
jgi:hypothetical protein